MVNYHYIVYIVKGTDFHDTCANIYCVNLFPYKENNDAVNGIFKINYIDGMHGNRMTNATHKIT